MTLETSLLTSTKRLPVTTELLDSIESQERLRDFSQQNPLIFELLDALRPIITKTPRTRRKTPTLQRCTECQCLVSSVRKVITCSKPECKAARRNRRHRKNRSGTEGDSHFRFWTEAQADYLNGLIDSNQFPTNQDTAKDPTIRARLLAEIATRGPKRSWDAVLGFKRRNSPSALRDKKRGKK